MNRVKVERSIKPGYYFVTGQVGWRGGVKVIKKAAITHGLFNQ